MIYFLQWVYGVYSLLLVNESEKKVIRCDINIDMLISKMMKLHFDEIAMLFLFKFNSPYSI